MARNTVLSVVRSMVKAESSKSLQSTSTAQDAEINQIIYDTQAGLAGQFDWAFLTTRWDSNLVPGQRYQVFPTVSNLGKAATINFERPVQTLVKWTEIWQNVEYGISEYSEFNYLDSDLNQVLDPIQRWQFSDEANFEVWPLPASNAQFRFIGQRMVGTLQQSSTIQAVGGSSIQAVGGGVLTSSPQVNWNDNATLDLDDLLIALFAAATYLAQKESPKAASVLAAANRRLTAQRGSYPTRTQPLIVGRTLPMDRKLLRQVPIVLVGGR